MFDTWLYVGKGGPFKILEISHKISENWSSVKVVLFETMVQIASTIPSSNN